MKKNTSIKKAKNKVLGRGKIYSNEIMPNMDYFLECNNNSKEIIPLEDNKIISLADYSYGNGVIWYISDIHIDFKIVNNIKRPSDKNIYKYIEKIAEDLLKNSYGEDIFFGADAIVFCGDTSASFEINKIFYFEFMKKLRRRNNSVNVFSILGNHEMWDFKSPEEAFAVYKDFFESIGIILLNNTLYVDRPMTIGSNINNNKDISTIEEDELLEMSTEDIRYRCRNAGLILWGGTGFAAFEPFYNADFGLYEKALRSREKEYYYSNKAEKCLKILTESLYKSNVTICSHMPLKNWCSEEQYQPKWKYISGHTHKNNKVIIEDEKYYYADNQIGYRGKNIKFKPLIINKRHNIFEYYDDGIYEITDFDYQLFYSGISKSMTRIDTRGVAKHRVMMLKRNGFYLFLLENLINKKLYLLEGGKRRMVNHDVKYFYDNMLIFSQAVQEATNELNNYLKNIAESVKKIGGSGRIHGSIVDIDAFNHISLDIRNGKIEYYKASDMVNRVHYSSFALLLKENRPELYEKYLEQGGKKKEADSNSKHTEKNIIRISRSDTSMYKYSYILLKVQDIVEYNVIRIWNDDIIESLNSNKDKIPYTKKLLSR